MEPEALAPEVLPVATVMLPDKEEDRVVPVTRLTDPEVAPLTSPLAITTPPLAPPPAVPLLNTIAPELPADLALPDRIKRAPDEGDVPLPVAMST